MVSTESQKKTHKRVYKNYWKMVEAEGGLMNKEFGMQVATNIATCFERRGPPFVMYDGVGKCMRYLHGEEGVDDEFCTAKKLVLSGELDIPEEIIQKALEQGRSEGLTDEIPLGASRLPIASAGAADGIEVDTVPYNKDLKRRDVSPERTCAGAGFDFIDGKPILDDGS